MSWDDLDAARIYKIERIRPRTDDNAMRWRFEWMGYATPPFWREDRCLPRSFAGGGMQYMLQLKNKSGAVVALF
jgi:hypothetical protein